MFGLPFCFVDGNGASDEDMNEDTCQEQETCAHLGGFNEQKVRPVALFMSRNSHVNYSRDIE